MHRPDITRLPKEDLIAMALKAAHKHMQIQQTPIHVHTNTARAAIPQYHVNHKARVRAVQKALREYAPCVSIAGNSWNGVGIADTVSNAKKVVRDFLLLNNIW